MSCGDLARLALVVSGGGDDHQVAGAGQGLVGFGTALEHARFGRERGSALESRIFQGKHANEAFHRPPRTGGMALRERPFAPHRLAPAAGPSSQQRRSFRPGDAASGAMKDWSQPWPNRIILSR